MGIALVRRIDEASEMEFDDAGCIVVDRYRHGIDGGLEGADDRDDEGVALAGAVREKVLRKRCPRRWQTNVR